MKTFNFVVNSEDEGLRLDTILTKYLGQEFSRNIIKKIIIENKVMLNEKIVKPSHKVKSSDRLTGELPVEKELTLNPTPLDLKIIYEDDDIIIVDKPTGLSVHPGAGNKDNTLANALVSYTQQLSSIDPQRPGIVHRLDKDTSGLVVIARNNPAHMNLVNQFKNHSVKKVYLAIVEGQVQFDQGEIDAPIAPDPRNREKMKVDYSCARGATTTYKVIKRFSDFSLVELYPVTGRTHQLRVHMKYLGHPILGDKKYGSRIKFNRLCLHAKALKFIHPKTNKEIEFHSPMPGEFSEFLDGLGKK
jgi:23S rRNA pseudouridine1911/1915/1917 synthase